MRNQKVRFVRQPIRRDPLKISLLMGKIIIILGNIGVFVQAAFAGFSLFIIICDYALLSDYQFMSYYSKISPSINFLNIYISVISCIINTTYTTFCWILVPRLYLNIILTVCIAVSIVTLILSLTNIKISQIFYAMTQRQSDWFKDPDFDHSGNWRRKAFIPFQAKEIIRCILYFIQALLYIYGHQFTNYTLIKQFDL